MMTTRSQAFHSAAGRPQGKGGECRRHCGMSESKSRQSMRPPGVPVEDFLCQGPQAGVLRVRDKKFQVGSQQQTLQQVGSQLGSSTQFFIS